MTRVIFIKIASKLNSLITKKRVDYFACVASKHVHNILNWTVA